MDYNQKDKPHLHIPDWELEFRADRSSGPGGQNVNKTATKITVHFDVRKAKSLNEEQKSIIFKKLKNHINKEGELVLSEQSSRSQLQNRVNAVRKLEEMILETLVPEKERVETAIPHFVKERILEDKKIRGKKKESRRPIRYDE